MKDELKRIGRLKHIWCNYNTLVCAFNEVKKNKSTSYEILKYEHDLVVNLNRVLVELESGTYQVKPFRKFTVWELITEFFKTRNKFSNT